MKKFSENCAIFTLGIFAAVSTHATIIGGDVTAGNGQFIELAVPFNQSNPNNTVGNNTFQNQNLYAFNEGQNILITSTLAVDDLGGGVAGTLSAGTVVASHYVFFDPNNSRSQKGYVDFDSDILGVISSTGNLAASDFLINNNVTYLNPGARGLEGNDSVTFNGSRVNVDWRASTPGDYVRVLTAFSPTAVPEASTLSMLFLGLFGLAVVRRRRA